MLYFFSYFPNPHFLHDIPLTPAYPLNSMFFCSLKKPKQYETKNNNKKTIKQKHWNPGVQFVLAIYSWTWGLSWCVVNKISITLPMTTDFPSLSNYHLWIASWLIVGFVCLCPHSCWEVLSGLSFGSSCAFRLCVCELLWIPALWCLENDVPLKFLTTSGSCCLFTPLPHRSLNFWGDVIKTSHSDWPFQSLSLHVDLLWVSVLIRICYQKSLLGWGLSDVLIYSIQYVIRSLLFLCSYMRKIHNNISNISRFSLGPQSILSQVHSLINNITILWIPSHKVVLKSKINKKINQTTITTNLVVMSLTFTTLLHQWAYLIDRSSLLTDSPSL